jgi:two-component system KDP operon response regulator KdpE
MANVVSGYLRRMARMARKRVPVVDDDPHMAQVIKLILLARGYEILSAATCAEGANRLREVHPDLVILDLAKDSSVERSLGPLRSFTADAREYAPSGRIPLLVVTSFRSMALRCFAEDRSHLQADDYVEKPLEPGALVQKVERLLSKQPETQPYSVE